MEYFLSLPRLPKHIISLSEIKDQGIGFLKVKICIFSLELNLLYILQNLSISKKEDLQEFLRS
jgi:hypothetical protein